MNPDLTDHHPEARAVRGVRWSEKMFTSINNVLTVNDGKTPGQILISLRKT